MTRFHLLLSALLSLTLVACGDTPAPDDAGPPGSDAGPPVDSGGVDAGPPDTDSGTSAARLDEAFIVTATMTFAAGGSTPPTDTQTFHVFLRDRTGEPTFGLVSNPGVVFQIELTGADSNRTFTLGSGAAPRFKALPDDRCNGDRISYDMFSFDIVNDSFGDPASLTGTATGSYALNFGDAIETVEFTATLTGVLDRTAPDATYPTDHNPIDPLRVVISETLDRATDVTLSGGGQTIELDGASDGVDYHATYETLEILPFGASYALEIDAFADMVFNENTEDITRTVTTLADPGLFAMDGFEASPNVALSGDAAVVGSVGSASALEGSMSLFVGLQGRATIRVPIGALDTEVTFQVARLYTFDSFGGFSGSSAIGAAVAGVERINLPFGDDTRTATGDSTFTHVGLTETVTVPIPSGAAGEVLLDFNTLGRCSNGEQVPPAAILVDAIATN